MKSKVIKFSSWLACLAFVAVFFGMAISNTPASSAVSAMDFRAGNIIDDGIFYNKDAMTVEEIQAHLNRYMPACDTWGTGAVGSGRYINGRAIPANTTRADYARQMREAGNARYHEPPYVCVQNFYENPETHETLYDTNNEIKEGMISAAQIIYDAAQKYNINPQVLLVMLRKESYVWGDNWPLKDEYNTVMGYACPDNAPCDTKYFGFYNQVETAAWQLNYYKEHIYSYNYRPYATNYILYSPTVSCGRKEVYLENIATTSLYIYTPYTPNDAALRNYPGTATCGSYGNRNFFMYFSEWFGDTHSFNPTKETIPDAIYRITNVDGSKMLYVADNSKATGAKILASSEEKTSASFSFKRNSDNSYTITNAMTELALDVPGGSATVGTEIQQWTSNSTLSQKWFLYADKTDGYYIASALSPSYVLSINSDNKIVLDIYGSQTSTPLKVSPVVRTRIDDGIYIIESALKKNMVIDLSANSNAEGANIQLHQANGTKAQDYTISFDETTGYYVIKNNYGKAVNAAAEPVKNGVNVQSNDDKGACAQRFLILKNEAAGNYTFYSSCDLSFTLDVAGGSTQNATNIQMYADNGTNSQRWNLIKKADLVKPEEPAPQPAPQPEPQPEPEPEPQPAPQPAPQPEPQPEPEPEPEKPVQTVADGDYVIHSALRDNMVIDIAGGSLANGANIRMWTKNGTTAQTFNVKYNAAKDAYLIVNPRSNHAIDLAGGVAKNSTNIHAYTINSTCAQYWKIKKDANGYYVISSTCNENFVLDVSCGYTKDGTNLQIYSSNGTKSQEWVFEKK